MGDIVSQDNVYMIEVLLVLLKSYDEEWTKTDIVPVHHLYQKRRHEMAQSNVDGSCYLAV